MNTMFAHLPDHQRQAGLAKAEQALHDLTAAANLLGIADRLTPALVSLWEKFQPRGQGPLVRFKSPRIDREPPRSSMLHDRRPSGAALEIIASAEGLAAIQDVLTGKCSDAMRPAR